MSIDLRRHAASDLGTIEGALLSVYGEVHAADGVFHSIVSCFMISQSREWAQMVRRRVSSG